MSNDGCDLHAVGSLHIDSFVESIVSGRVDMTDVGLDVCRLKLFARSFHTMLENNDNAVGEMCGRWIR